MKTKISIIILLILTLSPEPCALSQIPQGFNYQAVARDADGHSIINTAMQVRVTIQADSMSGTIFWQELHPSIETNSYGLFSLVVGKGEKITGAATFSAIDWSVWPKFLMTEINYGGWKNMGSCRIWAVPYAMYSKNAENSFSGNYSDLAGKPDFSTWDKDSTDNVIITGDQIIAGNKTFIGTTKVSSPINSNDAATKSYVDALVNLGPIPNNYAGSVTDIEGNIYKTVTIGTQIWMSENLMTAILNNGMRIQLVNDNTSWTQLTTPGYCWYEKDITKKATFGILYNWFTVATGKLCPTGWHVPTNTDWTTLILYLGGWHLTAGKIKERGTAHWLSPNMGTTNESGFTALPGGDREMDGSFNYIGTAGFWWSSTENDPSYAYLLWLNYIDNEGQMSLDPYNKKAGLSVRCLKD